MRPNSEHNTPALLADLLKCPSVTPEEAGALDVIERFLVPLGFSVTRLTFEGDDSYPVGNLFATRGTGGRHLLFCGHTDVVPPGDEREWTHPPFAAETAGGEMWGRGAVDMKSGIAAFCAAMARTVADGSADQGRLSLAITNDEEADAVNGSDKLLAWAESQGHRFDFALVGEPSSEQTVGDRLKVGRRGSYNGVITVRGAQGHAAYPEKARNPLPVLARLVTALCDTGLDTGHGPFPPSNLEVTSIDVGNPATNVIPATGTVRINIRFNDLWDAHKLEAWLAGRIASIDKNECDIVLERVGRVSESFLCPPAQGLDVLDTVIEEVTGAKPEHSTSGGTSDARFVAQYCPVVECGLVGETMHQTDERVPLADLDALTDIYAAFIDKFLSA